MPTLTPRIILRGFDGPYQGEAVTASALISGVKTGEDDSPSDALEGVGLTVTYYRGTNADGQPLPGPPTQPGIYTAVAFFAGSASYASAVSQALITIHSPPTAAQHAPSAGGGWWNAISTAGRDLLFAVKESPVQTVVIMIVLAVIVITGAYVARAPGSTNATEFNRGLITVLFSAGTIGIAVILTAAAILPSDDKFQLRFDKGKEILTVLIGIFGTIMGFYFGTATTPTSERPDGVKFALVAPPGDVKVENTEDTEAPIKLKLNQSGGKFPGNITLRVETEPAGISAKLIPDTIKPADNGEVVLHVKMQKGVKDGPYTLRVIATPDAGAVAPAEATVKIQVVAPDPSKKKPK